MRDDDVRRPRSFCCGCFDASACRIHNTYYSRKGPKSIISLTHTLMNPYNEHLSRTASNQRRDGWMMMNHISHKSLYKRSTFFPIAFCSLLFPAQQQRSTTSAPGSNNNNNNNYPSQANAKAEEFVCPAGFGNGNFADPATCRRFYQVYLQCSYYMDFPVRC